MTFRLHLHHHFDDGISEVLHLLRAIHSQGEKMAKTMAELVTELNGVKDELTALKTGIATVAATVATQAQNIADLKAELANQTLPQDAQDALAAVESGANDVRDALAAIATPPTPTP